MHSGLPSNKNSKLTRPRSPFSRNRKSLAQLQEKHDKHNIHGTFYTSGMVEEVNRNIRQLKFAKKYESWVQTEAKFTSQQDEVAAEEIKWELYNQSIEGFVALISMINNCLRI